VYALSQVLKRNSYKIARHLGWLLKSNFVQATISKILRLTKYILVHPIKSIIFLFKAYITFILFGFFLLASFSSFAELVPADSPRGAVYDPSYYKPYDNSDIKKIVCDFRGSRDGIKSCEVILVSKVNNSKYTVRFITVTEADITRTYNETLYFHASTEPATCPPSGYPTYTTEVWQGDTLFCEGTGGGGGEEPPPEPDQIPLNCVSMAGNMTEAFYSLSEDQLSTEDRADLNCMTFMDNKGNLYDQRCHVTGGSGNTVENQDPDSGLWQYTIIGGTISGYQCDATGTPISEDKYCTAFDTEGVKGVDCPDGSSMRVDLNHYDDYNEAFTAFRQSAQNDINTIMNSMATSEEVAQEIMNNPEYLEAVKGQGCGATWSIEGIYVKCGQGNEVFLPRAQAGAAGANGVDGVDGESCQTIQDGRNLRIVCPDSTATVSSGTDGRDGVDGVDGIVGVDGVDGVDGEGCEVVDLGNGDSEIICASSRTVVNGIDEDGVIAAIEDLKYTGSTDAGTFGTGAVASYVGAPNDYETRNYGTVMEAAVNRMRNSPLVSSVDTFFDVSITGSCPSYSADISFMGTSVTFDHWCRPVMDSIWPMIQGVIILLFSIIGFRAAIL
tara:strand:- start:156 stop:1991 length:1836 start_codon:yes stop_codon:yes gene_type:complete